MHCRALNFVSLFLAMSYRYLASTSCVGGSRDISGILTSAQSELDAARMQVAAGQEQDDGM